MNDQVVTKSHTLPPTDLVAYEKAVEAAGSTIRLAKRVPAPLRSLADQAIRSAASVPANLAEKRGATDHNHHNVEPNH